MKLLILFILVVLFSSCRKDWGCECTPDNPGNEKEIFIITKSSKKVAEGRCSDYEYPYTEPTTCTLLD